VSQKRKPKVARRKHATEDGFFSLDDMEAFVKAAEAAEYQDGDDGEDDDEEEVDYFHGTILWLLFGFLNVTDPFSSQIFPATMTMTWTMTRRGQRERKPRSPRRRRRS